MAKLQTCIVPLLLALVGIVIIGLCIGGIANAQLVFAVHLFIVILVLTVFALILGLFVACAKKASGKSSDYDVNDAERGGKRSKASSNGAKDNRGFVGDSSAGGNTEKWVSNYVPYGDFPAGSGGSGGEAPQQQQQQNGEASWKKNYVPYKEGGGGADEVDSNKKE